ncbi:MAG: hypothetical protein HY820_34110 [Acidobacteria bacterium]|nr:hypothetical protein [Acidobacteriota bacterium]
MLKPEPHRSHRSLGRAFGDLKVRPKLIVLHNVFFLILACAVYFSLIPLVENRVASARLRESSLLMQTFGEDRALPQIPGSEIYEFREGTAEALGIAADIRSWLDENPGLIWRDQTRTGQIYRLVPVTGVYRSARMPDRFYDEVMLRAKRTLFVVLGVIYVLAVLTLEYFIMPQYVYRPIQMMLRADSATQADDRDSELVRDEEIPGDEIGQIMRSRNQTVSELRRHEDHLAEALSELERIAADLRGKNEMLERAKKSLEDQDRLASIGLLSASVAHEMNTPLTVLHGSIEKLMETAGDKATHDRLARMLRVAERLKKISESLVDFARARKHETAAVGVRAVVDEAWSLLAIDDKASAVRFHNRVPDDHLVVGDMDRLIQVFLNLLRNSLNAIGLDGRIDVWSEISEERGRRWVLIRVDDDGPGIPSDVLPDIFDAFVTTRLDAKGTGLGLTVSEGIVRQHEGSIAASNREGGGARLEVRLPAVNHHG